MSKFIMVACDLHDKTMMLKIAEGRELAETVSIPNTAAGRARMIERLQARAKAAGNAQILFAHEASWQGFGLYDQLTEAGIQCHVLAPTKRSHESIPGTVDSIRNVPRNRLRSQPLSIPITRSSCFLIN